MSTGHTNSTPLDVQKLMRALVLGYGGPISQDWLRLAMAFEIREEVPDSKLLVGVSLGDTDAPVEMDILGLVGNRQLGVKVCLVQSDADDWSKDLEQLERVCAAAPDLLGLALIVTRPPWTGNGRRRLAWHDCTPTDSSAWAGLEYAFVWIDKATARGRLKPRKGPSDSRRKAGKL